MRTFQKFILVVAIGSFGACKSPEKKSEPQSAPAPTGVQPVAGDMNNGEAIFQKGTSAGVAACLSCHGAQGEGQLAAGFPRLAGQSQMYVVSQLHNYKTAVRKNPVMQSVASALTDQEMENVGAYIEQMAIPEYAKSNLKMKPAEWKRGQQLVDIGDHQLALQSCSNCHGPAGRGEPPNIPALAGQPSAYLQAQLKAWRTGERQSSANNMSYIAKLIPEKDIRVVADYLESLPSSEYNMQPPEKMASPVWNSKAKK